MRIWKPGRTIAEVMEERANKRKAAQNKPLTAAQRQRVAQLQKRIAEENRQRVKAITSHSLPQGTEIRITI